MRLISHPTPENRRPADNPLDRHEVFQSAGWGHFSRDLSCCCPGGAQHAFDSRSEYSTTSLDERQITLPAFPGRGVPRVKSACNEATQYRVPSSSPGTRPMPNLIRSEYLPRAVTPVRRRHFEWWTSSRRRDLHMLGCVTGLWLHVSKTDVSPRRSRLRSSQRTRYSVTARDREGKPCDLTGAPSADVNGGSNYIRLTCHALTRRPVPTPRFPQRLPRSSLLSPQVVTTANVQTLPLGVRMHTKLYRFLMALVLTTLCLAAGAAARGITEAPSVITPAPEAPCTLTNSIPGCGVSLKRVADLSS